MTVSPTPRRSARRILWLTGLLSVTGLVAMVMIAITQKADPDLDIPSALIYPVSLLFPFAFVIGLNIAFWTVWTPDLPEGRMARGLARLGYTVMISCGSVFLVFAQFFLQVILTLTLGPNIP